jgi:hypothetical protein
MSTTRIRKKAGAIQVGQMELRLCYGGHPARPTERQQRALESIADAFRSAINVGGGTLFAHHVEALADESCIQTSNELKPKQTR